MTTGPLVQVVLLIGGALPVLIWLDEHCSAAAMLWATGWTGCCWLIAPPGWARWVMLALTDLVALILVRSLRDRHSHRRAARHADKLRELELLLARADREQLTMIETVPARLRAYAQAARLLGADPGVGSLPLPPAEPRPGPGQLWQALDAAYRTAGAVAVAAAGGLARSGAERHAYQHVAASADELAKAVQAELRASALPASPRVAADDHRLRLGEGAA